MMEAGASSLEGMMSRHGESKLASSSGGLDGKKKKKALIDWKV
jgi:hypothetical protein